jgi:predicted anti-sigma-YlaC factor YlaD
VSGIATAGLYVHGGEYPAGGSAAHLVHESSAWNLAVAFGVTAATRRGPTGVVPVVGAYLGTLTVLSAVDLLAGRVDPARPAGHVLALVGFLLLLVLGRADRGGGRTVRVGGPQAVTERSTALGTRAARRRWVRGGSASAPAGRGAD